MNLRDIDIATMNPNIRSAHGKSQSLLWVADRDVKSNSIDLKKEKKGKLNSGVFTADKMASELVYCIFCTLLYNSSLYRSQFAIYTVS